MPHYSTDTVCGITGILPATLKNWRRAGLISSPLSEKGYSSGQLTRIFSVLEMTDSGDTLAKFISVSIQPHTLCAAAGNAARKN